VLLALPLAMASAATLASEAPQAPASPAVPAASTSSAPAAEALRYRVVIEAPEPLRDTLSSSVDLIRWQTYDEMTRSLFDALVRQARDQAQEAAATEGYFSATIDIGVDRASTPWTVTMRATPGAQARVTAATIVFEGAASTDDTGADAIAKVRREWKLPVGAPFRQPAWIDAKEQAVNTLAANAYAAARLAASEAAIDPDASTAELAVTLDSGPVFRVGDLEIQGLSRYTDDLVRNYRSARPGDRYSLADLDQFVRRLNGTGYFASVHAAIDTDPAKADDAPIHVSVIEAPPKRLEAGLGYSTDTAFRGNVSYRDVDVGGRALQMYADARVESKLQNASLRFVQPPARNGWSPSVFTRIERTDINSLVTQTAVAGTRMSSLDERNQWQYGAAFFWDRQEPFGQPANDSHALYVDVERGWRRVDNLASPTQGFSVLAQAGAGIPGVSTRGFGRAVVRSAFFQPLSPQWSLSARAEGGAVFAGSRTDIPSALLFRTGGDTTVRGYAFESLGLKSGDAVLPVRYYYATSVEATRWIGDAWGIAAFVDAGNAFDDTSDARPAFGYGVGARVRTPIGPFRLDLAYGQESRQVRLHFSVGVAF
jgi:translocation and assembly module TamA